MRSRAAILLALAACSHKSESKIDLVQTSSVVTQIDKTEKTVETESKAPETIVTVTERKEFDLATGKVKAQTRRKRVVKIGPIEKKKEQAVSEKQGKQEEAKVTVKVQQKTETRIASWSGVMFWVCLIGLVVLIAIRFYLTRKILW